MIIQRSTQRYSCYTEVYTETVIIQRFSPRKLIIQRSTQRGL